MDAVRFGIQTLSPQFFGGPPEFVVSGPNVGSKRSGIKKAIYADLFHPKANLGTGVSGSGTV